MTKQNDQNLYIKLLKTTKLVTKMRDVKLGIKKDATRGANDEAKHGVDMVANKTLLWMQNMALHRKQNMVQQ